MSSFDTVLVGHLLKRIVEERQKAVDILAGGGCQDLAQYRYSVGYIKALDDVVTIAGETETDLQKG